MNKKLLIKLIEEIVYDDSCADNSVVNKDLKPIFDRYIGQYVIVRSRNEGVNAGYVVHMSERAIVIRNARRLWTHKPKDINKIWYEGVALSGLSLESHISDEVPEKVIVEDYSITLCSDEAKESIINYKNNGK